MDDPRADLRHTPLVMVQRKLLINSKIIKQVTIVDKRGVCTLNLAYWEPNVDRFFYNKLLALINCYIEAERGLEHYEMCLKEHWMFVSKNESSLITVVIGAMQQNHSELRPKVLDFIRNIQELIECCHNGGATPVRTTGFLALKTFLQEQIELEITRNFSTPWDHPFFDEQFVADVAKIRILTILVDQCAYTLKEINEQLHLGFKIITERLDYLIRTEFVRKDIKFFKEKGYRAYSYTYSITEIGKFALDSLDSGFPGLWFQELALSEEPSQIFS